MGHWNPDKAVALSASQYTEGNPLWQGTVSLRPDTLLQYKYVKVSSTGTVEWEADPNHTYTVPCETSTAVTDTWQEDKARSGVDDG